MSDVQIFVRDKIYSGWKNVVVARSLESLSGSVAMGVPARWVGRSGPIAIAEGDECTVKLEGADVLRGHIDGRSGSGDGATDSLEFSGRDRAAVLVDCSAILENWTFRNANVVDVVRKLCSPYGIKVRIQPGLELLKAESKFVVSVGEKAFSAISRVAKSSGVLVVSDGVGGILITRSGTDRAASSLIRGVNIVSYSFDYSQQERYARYVVYSQLAGKDSRHGDTTRVTATAYDKGVEREDRTLIIRPASGLSISRARQRADWEGRARAASGDAISVTVRGWKDGNTIWPLNKLIYVKHDLMGIDGDLLISGATHILSGEDGSKKHTTLRLVRPDAYTPDPSAIVKPATSTGRRSSGRWKELP